MKYQEEMYVRSQISTDIDFYGSNLEEKSVNIRKPRKCCLCGNEFQNGEKMLMQKAVGKGMGWCSCYICLPCVEQRLEESGRVETGDDE